MKLILRNSKKRSPIGSIESNTLPDPMPYVSGIAPYLVDSFVISQPNVAKAVTVSANLIDCALMDFGTELGESADLGYEFLLLMDTVHVRHSGKGHKFNISYFYKEWLVSVDELAVLRNPSFEVDKWTEFLKANPMKGNPVAEIKVDYPRTKLAVTIFFNWMAMRENFPPVTPICFEDLIKDFDEL